MNSIDTCKDAFDCTTALIEGETLRFEARWYGKPFLPRNDETSAWLMTNFCASVDNIIGQSELHHIMWIAMSEERDDHNAIEYRMSGGKLVKEKEQRFPAEQILSKFVASVLKGVRPPFRPAIGSPVWWPNLGNSVLIVYVVFDEDDVSALIQSVDGRDHDIAGLFAAQGIDWKDRFVHCSVHGVKRGIPLSVSAAQGEISAKLAGKRVCFYSYHVISGIDDASFSRLDGSMLGAIRLVSMQFQREWGSREKDALERERLEREHYKRLLTIFGHGVGNQMRAAGLALLRDEVGTVDVVQAARVRAVIDSLWPLWGIGDLARTKYEKGVLKVSWLRKAYRDKVNQNGFLEHITRSDEDVLVCARDLLMSIATSMVETFLGRDARVLWNGADVGSPTPGALFPFKEDPYRSGSTLVTYGVMELICNACVWLQNYGPSDPTLHLDAAVEQGKLVIVVRYTVTHGDWERYEHNPALLHSLTISNIQWLEQGGLTSARGRIVETEQFHVDRAEDTVSARWMFDWRNIRWEL